MDTMDSKDRIALAAALVIVAGIIGFVVARGDEHATAAYYYLSIAPDSSVDEVTREVANWHRQPQEASGGKPVAAINLSSAPAP